MKATWILAALSVAGMVAATTPASAEGNAEAGAKVFNQCKACHTIEPGKNRIGPSLHGVYGRKAGTAPGFNYSAGMKESGITWDEASLNKWLTNTQDVVPHNKMTFKLTNPQAREDVIAYLKTQK